MKLLQLAMITSDLPAVVEGLCERLGIEVAFRDPAVGIFGLENAVLPVGDGFLEVLTPIREGTTGGRYLKRRGGDGGYMVIVQVDELAPERERLERLGVRIAWEGSSAPQGEDGPSWQGIHLHPADTGGALLSLDRPEPPDSWLPAGPDWRDHVRTGVVRSLRRAELQSDDPGRLAARWSQVLGRPLAGDEIALDRGSLRFVRTEDGRPEGLAGIELEASERTRAGETFELCGVRFRLV
jgi:hypothetical protein